jgi:hypothetical protein
MQTAERRGRRAEAPLSVLPFDFASLCVSVPLWHLS